MLYNATTETPSVVLPFQPLTKTYELLLSGEHDHSSSKIEHLRDPLVHHRGGNEYHSEGASIRFLRSFRSLALATEYSLLDCHDDDYRTTTRDGDEHNNTIEAKRHAILQHRTRTILSRRTGERIRPYVPYDRWVTEVSVTIHQGRHHQIQRLCVRAG